MTLAASVPKSGRIAVNWLSRLKTRHQFPDGGEIQPVSRHVLRCFSKNGRTLTVGIEQALEPGVDRLIHPRSIESVGPSAGVPVSQEERDELLARVVDYCEAKRLRYRIVEESRQRK